MNEKYDCTDDVMLHKGKVEKYMGSFAKFLITRAGNHDNSKLYAPIEKALFDEWTPNLKRVEYGSREYKIALVKMGDGLALHYKNNRHHPEHFENGINDMTLIDIVEMVCDWMAAAEKNGNYVDLDGLAERFGISEQLVNIIANHLREEDAWHTAWGVSTNPLCPPNKRKGHVEGFERVEK